ncbi:MAG: DUF998 domain-containing protein [Candidatus Bathyarchaeia archaeon]
MGLCGLLSPLLGFTFILCSISISPWFSWTHNALSDLGVGGSSQLFNLGLILSGVLLFLCALGLYNIDPGGVIPSLGWALLASSGLSLIGVGVFPENKGNIHLYFSVAFFALLASSLLVVGFGLISYRRYGLAAFTFSLGATASLVWLMPYEGAAIPEAISSVLGSVWIVAVSVLYLKGSSLYQAPHRLSKDFKAFRKII